MSGADLIGLTQWFELVVAGVAAVGAMGLAWKKWLRPAYRRVSAVMALISAQLQPNGGSSVVDRLERIEQSQQLSLRHFRRLESKDRVHERRLDKLEHDQAAKGGDA
jgi:hypothetical protein